MAETIAKKTGGKQYYYVIMIVVTFLMMFVGTQTSASFSIMVNAVKDSAGFSGTQSSSIFTVRNIAALICVFFGNKYFEKLTSRWAVTSAFGFGVIAMIIMMFAGSNIWIYYIGAVILGAAYAYTMMLPMALVIRKWFNKSRALAMSLCSAGTGLSGFIMSPILQSTVNEQGVGAAFRLMAIVFAVVGIVYAIFARSNPEDVGLEPYGGYDYVDPKAGATQKKGAMKTNEKAVMGFIVCAFLFGMMSPVSQSHFVMHFNNLGYDSMLVATAYGVVGLCLLFSKIGFGVLSKVMKFHVQSVIFALLYTVSLGLTFFTGMAGIVADWVPFTICVIFGIAGALCSLGYPNWIADFTTRDDYPARAKNAQFGYQLGEIVAVSVPGIIADATGHYTMWFGIAACFSIVIIAIVLRFYLGRDKAETEEA